MAVKYWRVLVLSVLLAGCSSPVIDRSVEQEADKVEPTYYQLPAIQGRVINLASHKPVVGAQVSHANYPQLSTLSNEQGVFLLPSIMLENVALFIPAAGQHFQPIHIEAAGLSEHIVWLPSFLRQYSGGDQPEVAAANAIPAGVIVLDPNVDIAAVSLSESAVPYLVLQNPWPECDSKAWLQAAQLTNIARKYSNHLDRQDMLNSSLTAGQQLVLMDVYQHMDTAWKMTEQSCQFDRDRQLQAAQWFQNMAREVMFMRRALDLVAE